MNVKEALEKIVLNNDWKKFRINGKDPIELIAKAIINTLIREIWWDKVDYFLKFSKPMVDFLKEAVKIELSCTWCMINRT